MRKPWAHIGAALSIVGLFALISIVGSGEPPAESPRASDAGDVPGLELRSRSDGSALPCAVPLGWRIARIDERFAVTGAEVRDAVEEAASLWEPASDLRLFVHSPKEGFPIRFVYDERQERSRARRRIEEELAARAGELHDRGARLDSLARRLTRRREDFRDRVREFERRAEAHNMSVRRWRQGGDPPAAVARDLRETGRALEEKRGALDERRRELERTGRRIRAARARLRRDTESHERRVEEALDLFPTMRVQSGLYREAVRRRDGSVSVSREIRIHRFDGPTDLRRVIAHELGHALGLGHTDAPGALMSPRYRQSDVGDGAEAVTTAHDFELLWKTCPELRRGAGG